MLNDKPRITIGIPIYNGEKFVQAKLENILSQTFQDFEIIISDNNSTDDTSKICENFANNDKRIHFTKQSESHEVHWNHVFTLKNSISDYFVWAAVDDLWEKTFLEENISYLDSHPETVGSISKVDQFNDEGQLEILFQENSADSFILKLYKKFRRIFRPWEMVELTGTYHEKIRSAFKTQTPRYVHGVVRTNEFKKSVLQEPISAKWEIVITFNLLKFGNFHIIKQTLMHYYMEGYSSGGIISSWKQKFLTLREIIFPLSDITLWFLKKLGLKFVIKNIDLILWFSIYNYIAVIVEILKTIKND